MSNGTHPETSLRARRVRRVLLDYLSADSISFDAIAGGRAVCAIALDSECSYLPNAVLGG